MYKPKVGKAVAKVGKVVDYETHNYPVLVFHGGKYADAKVKTKVVANPIPMAVSIFLDTPMKGHNPKNLTSTKLLTSTVPINKSKYSIIIMVLLFLMGVVILNNLHYLINLN